MAYTAKNVGATDALMEVLVEKYGIDSIAKSLWDIDSIDEVGKAQMLTIKKVFTFYIIDEPTQGKPQYKDNATLRRAIQDTPEWLYVRVKESEKGNKFLDFGFSSKYPKENHLSISSINVTLTKTRTDEKRMFKIEIGLERSVALSQETYHDIKDCEKVTAYTAIRKNDVVVLGITKPQTSSKELKIEDDELQAIIV